MYLTLQLLKAFNLKTHSENLKALAIKELMSYQPN